MGYDLKIGEAKIIHCDEMVSIDCDIVRLDNAPAYGEPTDRENQRWPGYGSWAKAMEALGLTDVMFNERNGGDGSFEWDGETRYPLIGIHPGVMPITKEHVAYIEDRIVSYKSSHPAHRAEYPPPKPGAEPIDVTGTLYRDEDYVDAPEYDGWLCRGEWLLFWTRWAVENCDHPVFVNT